MADLDMARGKAGERKESERKKAAATANRRLDFESEQARFFFLLSVSPSFSFD